MKKLKNHLLLLTLTLILSLHSLSPIYAGQGYHNFTVKYAYTGFQDVSPDSWYLSGVRSVFERDLMKGISPFYFKPNENLTAAEAVTLAVRLYEVYYNAKIVQEGVSKPWYQKYIDAAISYNILNESYFTNYNVPINRTEFASLYINLFPFTETERINKITVLDIPDIDNGNFLSNDIITMYNYGIMTGDKSLRFSPKAYISRAEAATIIARMFNPSLRKKLLLSRAITSEKHIERPYDWFSDQNQSGNFSQDNCGPAVTSMILKWYNQANTLSAEDLRKETLPNGGWWSTKDIEKYMNTFQIPYQQKPFNNTAQIINELKNNRIVLVSVDGFYFSEYYENAQSGHFMLIKGYTNQNGIIRFETYNPDSGKNYYYFADNIKAAADQWWQYYYAIGN